MDIKYLVFTDMDGTLLDHHSYSFQPAVPMLEQLATHQIPVIPNTSKTFAELMILREKISLDTPFIVENGAAVYIPKTTFSEQPEGTDSEGDYWVKAFSQPRQYWLVLLAQYGAPYKSYYKGFSDMTTDELSLATGLSLKDAQLANTRQFSEPLQWLGDEKQKTDFTINMQGAGANVLQGGRFVHISGKCNKGIAMNWLTQCYEQLHKQQDSQATTKNIALGDSFNDNDMLEAADIAVQIKSPKHSYPKLFRTDNLWQSEMTGPSGWTECLQKILKLS
ncbi:MAG: HAD-IIB family hydrolase [Gammaproteobacteria bacterium]|nr:HAD-IIB family hydrolase [Gammaproteobacteria bacterium]